VQPSASPPQPPAQTARAEKQKPKAVPPATPSEWTSREVTRQAVPSIGRIDGSSSTMLMLGGLTLLALVIFDTVFLTISTRTIRRAG
jgi:hypothetical protein